MKRLFYSFSVLLVAVLLVGCGQVASSGSAEPDYADDEVILAISQGLEDRFDLADEQEAEQQVVNADYYAGPVQVEIDAVSPFRNRQFEDPDLQEAVLSYVNVLEDSLEVTETYPIDSLEFFDEWQRIYDERTTLLKLLVDEYGLEVDEFHSDALNDLLINAKAVEQKTEVEDAINELVSSIVFTKVNDGYGLYTYTATVQNTSGLNLEDVSLVLSLYDSEGVMAEESYASVSSWPNGETVRFEAIGSTDAAQIKVSIDFYSIAD